jgi:hypothetical protein
MDRVWLPKSPETEVAAQTRTPTNFMQSKSAQGKAFL